MLIGDCDWPSEASARMYAREACSASSAALAAGAGSAGAGEAGSDAVAAGVGSGAGAAAGAGVDAAASSAELAGFCELHAVRINTARGALRFFTVPHKY